MAAITGIGWALVIIMFFTFVVAVALILWLLLGGGSSQVGSEVNVTQTSTATAPTAYAVVTGMTTPVTGKNANISYSATLIGGTTPGIVSHQIMVDNVAVATFSVAVGSTPVNVSYTYLYMGTNNISNVSVNWQTSAGTITTAPNTNRTLVVVSWI